MDWVKQKVEAEPYWFQKIEVLTGLLQQWVEQSQAGKAALLRTA